MHFTFSLPPKVKTPSNQLVFQCIVWNSQEAVTLLTVPITKECERVLSISSTCGRTLGRLLSESILISMSVPESYHNSDFGFHCRRLSELSPDGGMNHTHADMPLTLAVTASAFMVFPTRHSPHSDSVWSPPINLILRIKRPPRFRIRSFLTQSLFPNET